MNGSHSEKPLTCPHSNASGINGILLSTFHIASDRSSLKRSGGESLAQNVLLFAPLTANIRSTRAPVLNKSNLEEMPPLSLRAISTPTVPAYWREHLKTEGAKPHV